MTAGNTGRPGAARGAVHRHEVSENLPKLAVFLPDERAMAMAVSVMPWCCCDTWQMMFALSSMPYQRCWPQAERTPWRNRAGTWPGTVSGAPGTPRRRRGSTRAPAPWDASSPRVPGRGAWHSSPPGCRGALAAWVLRLAPPVVLQDRRAGLRNRSSGAASARRMPPQTTAGERSHVAAWKGSGTVATCSTWGRIAATAVA